MPSKVMTTAVMVVVCAGLVACSTTQKTGGEGLTSVVAQNVVRIACLRALQDADMSALQAKTVEVKLSGFTDDRNKGILELLFRSRAEAAGARLVPEGKGEVQMEIATMNAGNDAGGSSIPILSRSERTEGTVDVQMSLRELATGNVLVTQQLVGHAKYQQNTVIGFQGAGKYYVQNKGGKFEVVPDPSTYN